MRVALLVAAFIGAVVPMWYFIGWFNAHGWDLAAMIDAWHANAATSGLVWDLTISALVLSLVVCCDVVRHRAYRMLLVLPATFCIGVSCGLPLYFYFVVSRRAVGGAAAAVAA